MQMSLEKHRDLPDVPLLIDLATNPDVKAVFELMSVTADIGRPFVTAPGVPAERVAALRQAFAKTMTDPEFLADAAKANIDIKLVDGHELEALVAARARLAQERDRAAQDGAGAEVRDQRCFVRISRLRARIVAPRSRPCPRRRRPIRASRSD